jgi:hypothetical protein
MRWFKRILVLIAVLALVVGIIFLGFVGIGLYVFSQMDGGFLLPPPQDCMLLERDINGRAQDKNGQPIKAKIKIQAGFSAGFEAGKVDLSLTTDQNGRFSANDVEIFACDVVSFEITATGYTSKEMRFIAAQEEFNSVGDQENYGDPDYRTPLAYGNNPVMPRQIIIELP